MNPLLLLTSLACLAAGVYAACSDNTDCGACASDRQFWISCRWCPLTKGCHAYGSIYNDCKSSQQVTSRRNCPAVVPANLPYSSDKADTMAKWSSVAYIKPAEKDKDSIQNIIASEIASGYRVIEFLLNDCDVILDFAECAVVVAISEEKKHLVVAFRGSVDNGQIEDQILTGLTGMDSFVTGGNILSYNKHTHDSLYPCIKSLVQEQLAAVPDLTLTITGFSLGGAQASLTAANLIYDGLVAQSNVEVYTLGGPRVGDREFAYNFDKIIRNSWRVTNRLDPVPQLVPRTLLGLSFAYHTGTEIFYNTDDDLTTETSFTVCNANEDVSCVRGQPICLTDLCLLKHLNYFVTNINGNFTAQISAGTAATEGVRGECRSFVL